MADAERNLDIKITTQADTPAVAKYAREIENVGRTTQQAGRLTALWVRNKTALSEAVRGLSQQFPVLSRAVSAMVNPITASFALIAVAINSLVKTWKAAREQFNLSAFGTEKINAAAAAWEQFGETIKKISTGAAQLDAHLDRIARRVETIGTVAKKLNEDMEANPLFSRKTAEAQANARSKAAAEARDKAAELQLQADAVKTGGDDLSDRNIMQSLEADASVAQEKVHALNRQIAELEELDAAGSGPLDLARRTPHRLGFGDRTAIGSASLPDAIEKLKGLRDAYSGPIATRDEFARDTERNKAARGAQAALRSKAAEMLGFASEQDALAAQERHQAQVDYGARLHSEGFAVPVNPTGSGIGISPQAAADVRQAIADANALSAAWKEAMSSLRRDVDWLKSQGKTKPE